MDDFLIGLAVGEENVAETKKKMPKIDLRGFLNRIVVDNTGMSRPKFINPKTGKAFNHRPMSSMQRSPSPRIKHKTPHQPAAGHSSSVN